MLEFQNFRKEYGGKPVIGIPSLFIPKGLHWIREKMVAEKAAFSVALQEYLPSQVLLS